MSDFRIEVQAPQPLGITSTPQFARLGLGAVADANIPFYVIRTSAPTVSGDSSLKSEYSYAVAANDIIAGGLSEITNTGNATGSAGHAIGLLGHAVDNVSALMSHYGLEGRADISAASSGSYYQTGVLGRTVWTDSTVGNSTTFAGNAIGLQGGVEIYNHDGSTPRQQGLTAGLFITNSIGGANNYGVFVNPQTGGGTANITARIDGSATRTLWLSGDADRTTAPYGIFYGSSADTTLYRSAASTLTTDGIFRSHIDSNGTTINPGIILQNTTTGSIQVSPSLRFIGNAYGGSTNYPATWEWGMAENGSGIGGDLLLTINVPAASINKNPVLNLRYDGTGSIAGAFQAGGFTSSDGSAGISTTITSASLSTKTITVKNGLITSFA